jgi:LmbE family N-acetylglucosaminyl deacetylase
MTDQNSDFYIPASALVIVAHADDIEFYAGTIIRWTDAGTEVTYCIVTDGAAGSNSVDYNRETLIETRRLEQIAAADAAGVSDVRFLNYPDGTLEPTIELRKDLTRIIRELRPDVVVIPDPNTYYFDDNTYVNHPDHRAVGEAGLYAAFPSAGARPIFPDLLTEGYEPHDVTKVYLMIADHPNVFIDVTSVYERKLQTLRSFPSQFGEDLIDMVRQGDVLEGQERGWQYGESFRVLTLRQIEPTTPSE